MKSALPRPRETWIALALCAFAYLYVVPYQPRINNPNENVRLYMTAALAEQGTYVIDDMRARWGWVNDCAVRDGVAYSVKAPATSFLGVPPYYAYYWLSEQGLYEYDVAEALWVCRLFASILPWLVFLFWFHRWLGRHTHSALLRDGVFLSVALGSCLYGYGVLFMSHTLSAAAGFAGFALLYEARHAGRIRPMRAFWAGLLVAGVTLFEYPGFVASFALAVYGLCVIRPWKRLLPFALGGMIPTAAMMHFQWRCFGSPFSPGHLYVETDFLRERHEEGFFGAVGLQWEAVYGLLVHPGAGLFPLTPILVFGVVGLAMLLWHKRQRADALVTWAVILATLLGISVMNNWRGGWTVGPRYLVIVYPFLGWAALRALGPLHRKAPALTAAIVLGTTAASFVLSGVPSAYYPHYPIEIDRPLTQVVALLVEHDFAPYTALTPFDVHGGLAMVPLAAAAIAALCLLVHRAGSLRARLVGVGLGAALAIAIVWPASIDPRPDDPEILAARGVITRLWDPRGHDDAARLAMRLEGADEVRPEQWERLAELYEVEGRDREARRARARAASSQRAAR